MKVKIEKIQGQIDIADEGHVTARQMYKRKEPLRENKNMHCSAWKSTSDYWNLEVMEIALWGLISSIKQ